MDATDAIAAAPASSPEATAVALESAAVVRWWQTTAFLEVAGPDAASFLDGLCTQAVERIAPGRAVLGLFLDAKARVIAPAVLHRVHDGAWTEARTGAEVDTAPRLLLETLPDLVEPLHAHLSRYRLRARVSIEAREVATIALVGPGADHAAAALGAVDGGCWTDLAGQGRPTMVFTGDAAACALLVGERLPAAGVVLADPDTVEADRIEQGIAGLHDLLPGRMPAEVGGMASAVALDAGCYLGQEPVARLHYRGHANRTLRRLVADAPIAPGPPLDSAPEAHLELRRPGDPSDARALGRLTTWARRADGGSVALAVLRREVGADEELVLAPGDGPRLRTADAAQQ